LPAPVKQMLLFMLAVDFQKQCAQFSQLRKGGIAPVDPCLGTAIGTDDAPQLAFAVFVVIVFTQPCRRSRGVGQIECGTEFRTRAAESHHAGVGTGAGQAQQGIDNQGFTGTGFTGNYGKSGFQSHGIGGNHGEIFQVQLGEHVAYFALFAAGIMR